MSEVLDYLDCGCAILKDGGRLWCPSCLTTQSVDCARCGNPGAQEYSDAIDTIIDNMHDLDMDLDELAIFEKAGKEAVEHYRKCGGEPQEIFRGD